MFDDFAPELEQLLEEGRRLPNPPRAIVVDEYQDLTAVELRLLQMIASEGDAGVFACGDDIQSIYGFRDAAIGGLKNFPTQYGISGPAYLDQSRRCPKPIIDFAEEVAVRMPGREALAERPRMTSLGDKPGEVRVLTFPSHVSETRWVVREVDRRRRDNHGESIAVIVPTSLTTYIRAFNEAANRDGLDLVFTDSRTRLPLEDDKGFRFAYALLRLASDRQDQLAWRTVLHLVPRQPTDRISTLYHSGDSPLTVALRARAGVDGSLSSLIDRTQRAVADIIAAGSRHDLQAAIDDAARDLRVTEAPWGDILAVLDEPMTAEEEGVVAEETPEHARELLTAARRAVSRVAADVERTANEVLVFTVFQAKGQEWGHVFLAGAYRKGFRDQHRVGEGTRLLYVSMTRAVRSLTITKFNSAARHQGLIAAAGTQTPMFPAILVEAAKAAGIQIEEMGPQA